MGAKIAGDSITLPILREMRASNDLQPAKLRVTPRADALRLTTQVGVGKISSAGQSIANALRARAVGYKRLAVIVKSMPPRIAKPPHKNSQIHGRRTQMPYPSAVQP